MNKNLAYPIMRFANRLVNDNRLRLLIWRLFLRFRPLIPREFMIRAGDIVVAIGVPFFDTIRRFSMAADTGRVIVIEADKANKERLENAIRAEGLNNVHIIGKAAWSKPGNLRFLIAKRDEDHRIENADIVIDNDFREAQESGSYRESIIVEASTIDQMMNEAGVDHIDYIEITVNGAELEVIKGMNGIIPRTSIIFAKGHVRDKITGEPLNKSICSHLRDYGFDTSITIPSRSVATEWGMRDGDVYAWRTPSSRDSS